MAGVTEGPLDGAADDSVGAMDGSTGAAVPSPDMDGAVGSADGLTVGGTVTSCSGMSVSSCRFGVGAGVTGAGVGGTGIGVGGGVGNSVGRGVDPSSGATSFPGQHHQQMEPISSLYCSYTPVQYWPGCLVSSQQLVTLQIRNGLSTVLQSIHGYGSAVGGGGGDGAGETDGEPSLLGLRQYG